MVSDAEIDQYAEENPECKGCDKTRILVEDGLCPSCAALRGEH